MVKHQPKDIAKFVWEHASKNYVLVNEHEEELKEIAAKIIDDYGLHKTSVEEVAKILKEVQDCHKSR